MLTLAPRIANAAASILVVEDRAEMREVLRRALTESGYTVLTAGDGDAGLAAAREHAPDLVILDVGLPRRDGLAVTRVLRAEQFSAPILMLTAHGTVSDKVQGFDAGADDYLAKPYNHDELLCRVRALLRRSRTEANIIRHGDITCDPLTRSAARGARPLALTKREFAVLELLLRNGGRLVTREMLAEQVWRSEFTPENNVIDVYISYLRAKLVAGGEPQVLMTVRGRGYILRAEDD
ncbi:MAG TPA: response regulator transcription factor [Gemmatimonadaceae bacterium]|jgi:two-component system response regulator MprA|nr:response regulator transcription factor [Gemmatimonadaceae bacterium]